MCLGRACGQKAFQEWLKNKPEIITAYKAVDLRKVKGGHAVMAPVQDTVRYKKRNVRQVNGPLKNKFSPYPYYANYHLFCRRYDAERWLSLWGTNVIRCSVPKSQVTAVGNQMGLCIVTKEFSFNPTKEENAFNLKFQE